MGFYLEFRSTLEKYLKFYCLLKSYYKHTYYGLLILWHMRYFAYNFDIWIYFKWLLFRNVLIKLITFTTIEISFFKFSKPLRFIYFHVLIYFIDYAITIIPTFLCLVLPFPVAIPSLSSCPWVMQINSLAIPFPILFLTSPCLFCT